MFCIRCVYPEHAVNITFDNEGVCSACVAEADFVDFDDAEWARRKSLFSSLIGEYRSQNEGNYDCIIAVSGGKDSYYQAHVIAKEFGLKALLVTYHGNNYLPEGQGNLDRMREQFNSDHLVFGPSVETLVKLNRAGFKKMGDMNWHAHAGIKTVPMIAAVKYNIPLVIWGEATWSISGMFSANDFVEYNRRTVVEHDLRGYNWRDMVGFEGLEARDLYWLRMPTDNEIESVGVRGIYIGNYFPWRPVEHTLLVEKEYGFERARQPFERTYRDMSNLDDMHENGIHDYLKFVKFGYGRASDHASKDIRSGLISRDEGIEIVRKYDHVKPTADLNRWLTYVGMKEDEFDRICDGFRDPRVWSIDGDEWVKSNVWGGTSKYGEVKIKGTSDKDKYKRIGF
jgi:N-acetyl sugar amidotransferase